MHGDSIEVREDETGKVIEIDQVSVRPFGLGELLSTRSEGNEGLSLSVQGSRIRVDDEPLEGRPTVNTTITFHESPKPFVLVPDGWAPLALSPVHNFLIDRNILSLLRKLSSGSNNARLDRFQWWTNQLNRSSVTLNPLPAAWEGGAGSVPSFNDFVKEFDSASNVLREAFPVAKVVAFGHEAYHAAYAEIAAVQRRQVLECELLVETCPVYLANPIARDHRAAACQEILVLAAEKGISALSLVMLCIMSSLYRSQDAGAYSIGHELLKPKSKYAEANAYNALSDLRHLEISALATGIFVDPPALVTEDTALAALWTVLRPRGIISGENTDILLEVPPELFNTLDARSSEGLANLLKTGGLAI